MSTKRLVLCMLCMAFFACEKEEIFEEETQFQEIKYQESIVIEVERNDRARTRGEGELEEALKSYFSSLKNQKKVVKNKWGDINWTFSKFSTVTEQGELAIIPVATDKSDYTEALLLAFMPESGNKIFIKGYDRKDIVKLTKKKNAKKDKKGKIVELTKELGLGNLLVLDGEIYGSADCDLVDDLFDDGSKARNVNTRQICIPVWTANISCQTITVGSTTDPNQHSYTECTTSYSIESVCSNGGTEDETPKTPTPSGGGASVDIVEILPGLQNVEVFKCLYDKFIKGNNSLFCNTIGAFDDAQNFTLFFDDKKNSTDVNCRYGDGCTDDDEINNNILTIYIDPNQSPLDMAGTILHEGIHSAMRVFLQEKGVNVTVLNKKQLISYYDHYKSFNYAEHFHMSKTYVQPIAEALQELDNNKNPIEHYYSIAWVGLDEFTHNKEDKEEADYYLREKNYSSELNKLTVLCNK